MAEIKRVDNTTELYKLSSRLAVSRTKDKLQHDTYTQYTKTKLGAFRHKSDRVCPLGLHTTSLPLMCSWCLCGLSGLEQAAGLCAFHTSASYELCKKPSRQMEIQKETMRQLTYW